MKEGSPSRRSWADEADEELPSLRSLGAGSPGLGRFAFLESPSSSREDRVVFSDSEGYSESEPPSPPPEGKGTAVVGNGGRRRRRRRHRRRLGDPEGFMAAVRPRRRSSPVTHPARASSEPDAEGFFRVQSPPKPARPVPPGLVGKCFNCLASSHVKADCTFPSRCFNCEREGHRAWACPQAQIDIQAKKRKAQAKKITGFQFAPGNPAEVLVTSADSQIRVFDGVTMVQKFRGFKNTSSQITAAYTSDGRYAVCASEDSNVYLWRTTRVPPAAAIGIGMKPKTWCTIRSYENFYCKDVSAAVPWTQSPPPPGAGDGSPTGGSPVQGASCNDESCSVATKPEGSDPSNSAGGGGKGDSGNAWGLVVVTASLGGEIRVYQNFGMPFRIKGQGNLFY